MLSRVILAKMAIGLRMRCVTWPVCRGPETTKNLET